MLSAKNITVGYEGHAVLQNVSISADSGERIALLGLNGTGKSTLLLSLATLLPVLKGDIYWGAQSLSELSAEDRARLVAVVTTDRVKTGSMTTREVVAMGRYPYTGMFGKLSAEDEHIVSQVADQCGLIGLYDQPFSNLSDGQKQRALIARALAQQTPLILLDEPTSFLDVRGKKEVFDLLAQLDDQLVIFSTHEVESAVKVASRCWVIGENGKCNDVPVSGVESGRKIREALGLTKSEGW